ncbi:MAG: MFS transporter [Methanomassiliicoccales archaeon]
MVVNEELKKKMLMYRWVIFGVLAFAYFFVYFHRVSTAVVATDIQTQFGVGATSIALLSSAYFYTYTIMQLPSGILTDSWGPKKTAGIFTLILASGAVLCGVATSFEMVVAGRLLIGLGAAMVYIPIMKILAVWFRKYEFATASGMLLAVGSIGSLSAATPLALMSDAIGWQQVFVALGVVSVITAVVIFMTCKDRPQDKGYPTVKEIEAFEKGETLSEEQAQAVKAPEKIPMKQALKSVFGSGMKFWPLAIWFFFLYGSIMVYQGLWGGPFFRDVLGWDKATYAASLTFIGIGMIFGCPLAGILSDKVLKSRKLVLVIGTFGYTAVWVALYLVAGNVESTQVYMAIHFLFGFFGGFFVVCYAMIKEHFPISIAGTSTAALNIFPFAGGAVLQMVTGYMVLDFTLEEYQGVWLFMLVGMVIACIAILMAKERPRESA